MFSSFMFVILGPEIKEVGVYWEKPRQSTTLGGNNFFLPLCGGALFVARSEER